MKYIYISLFAFSLFFISCGTGDKKSSTEKTAEVNTESAIAYNNQMVTFHSEIENSMVSVFDAIDMSGYEDMLFTKEEALQTVKEVREKVNNLEDFDGSDDFKKEMFRFLDTYEEILTNELSELIEMNAGTDAVSEKEMEYYNQLYGSALDKYDVSFNEFSIFQQNFAEKWNFSLETY
jgi:hypothetical protein